MGKMAFTIPEASKEGAGSRTVIYQKIKSGELKAKKRGRSTIILAADLEEYLQNLPDFHKQETETPAVGAPPPGSDSFSQRRSTMETERDEHMSKPSHNQA